MGRRRIKVKPKKSTPAESAKFKLRVLFFILLGIFSIPMILLAHSYTFVNGWLPLWEISLGVGFIVGILIDIFCASKKKWKNKAEEIAMRILIFFFTLLFTFALTLACIYNANHFFDSGEVQRYYAEIEEKHYVSNRSKFTFTVDGFTFDLGVLTADYNSHDVGDSYVIEYHEGALGEPYYIAVGPVP
ncbi:MAG: hypothetical protein J6M35_00150 [Clostridia bacterium]|nr:hypothetical protein [Clostridia bacterium]